MPSLPCPRCNGRLFPQETEYKVWVWKCYLCNREFTEDICQQKGQASSRPTRDLRGTVGTAGAKGLRFTGPRSRAAAGTTPTVSPARIRGGVRGTGRR